MNYYKEDMQNYHKGVRKARHCFFHYALRKKQQRKKGFRRKIWSFLLRLAQSGTGCEITTSNIGRRIFFPHMSGIIISYFSKIGDDCVICQQVTIGRNRFHDYEKAPVKAPVIGNKVFIGAGAKIIGPITVGDNVRIGANTVVTKDVPSDCTVVGANRIIHRGEKET